MSDFASNLRFKLFGSSRQTVFNNALSLYDNFVNLCSLSVFREPSLHTIQLQNILKTCTLTTIKLYNVDDVPQVDRLKDVANLQFAIRAVKVWLQKRSIFSTRTKKIEQFLNTLVSLESNIRVDMQQRFQHSLHYRAEDKAGFTSSGIKIRSFINPKYTSLDQYLTEDQNKLFDAMKKSEEPEHTDFTEINFTSHRRLFMAFLMPFVNLGLDFDCLNCMLDSLSSCLNFVKVF